MRVAFSVLMLSTTTAPRLTDVHAGLHSARVAAVVTPHTPVELAAAIRTAARDGRSVSVAGARHSMGGQAFGSDTLHVDTCKLNRVLDLDEERGLLTVEAGIRWPEVVRATHDLQGSPPRWVIGQKQTGADQLSLGGALAANIHGRGLAMKPIVGDVEWFELLDAQGELQCCSRETNNELFALAIGGYGLFGIVTAVCLRLRERCVLRRSVQLHDADGIVPALQERIDAGCLYGDFQFAIDPRSRDFLRRGVLSTYLPTEPDTPIPGGQRKLSKTDWIDLLHLAHTSKTESFQRYAEHYLSTDGQLYASDESQLGVYLEGYHEVLDEREHRTCRGSEVITELYVPRERLTEFLADAAIELRTSGANVVYGTVRLIERDDETFLPWAREPWACTVLNLHVDHTRAGRARVAADLRRLIDVALRFGGSYYLTYHRFARRSQLEAAHPRIHPFLAAKLRHDPEERFASDWYIHTRELLAGADLRKKAN